MVRLLITMSFLAASAVPLLGFGDCGKKALTPEPGVKSFQAQNFASFPKGISVNLAGGNAVVRRTDLSIDTRVGSWNVGAVYNSATGEWLHNFEMTYDGTTFVDDTGAEHDLNGFGAYARVEGTHWVRIDSDSVKTISGLVYEFENEILDKAYWASDPDVHIDFVQHEFAPDDYRISAIDQCIAPGDCENVYTFTYDPATSQLTAITDRANRNALFTYYGNGQLKTAQDGFDVEQTPPLPGFRYAYVGGNLTSVISSEDEEVQITYDTAQRVKSVTLVGISNPTWSITHLKTKVATIADPDNDVTTYRFDVERRLNELELPTGETTEFTWNAFLTRRLASITSPSGAVTNFQYPLPNVTQVFEPAGDLSCTVEPCRNIVTTTFAAYDNTNVARTASTRPVINVVDSIGTLVSNTYDGNGRLVSSMNGEDEETVFTYHSDGALESVTQPNGRVTVYTDYGNHGHAETRTIDGRSLSQEYDLVGNHTKGSGIVNPYDPSRPGICERVFDADRNLLKLEMNTTDNYSGTCVSQGTIVLHRRSDGRINSIDRPFGGNHEFEFNQLGQLVERREWADGNWRPTIFEYHADGKLAARQVVNDLQLPLNGMRREIDYDATGRVGEVRLIMNGSVQSSVNYVYDAHGRLSTKADSNYAETERFSYDDADRPVWHHFGREETVTSDYDLRSRIKEQKFRNQAGVKVLHLYNTYDLANRLINTDDATGLVRSATFANGQLANETLGNGITRSYTYDGIGRIEAAQSVNPSMSVVENTSVTRELGPQTNWVRVTKATTSTSVGVVASTTEEFSHSNAIQVEGGSMTYDNGWSHNYDVLTNYSLYSYNPEHNRILSGAGLSYGYDDAGFTTSRGGVAISWDAGGRVAAAGTDTFGWDVDGRPITRNLAGEQREYRYGGIGYDDASGDVGFIDVGDVRFDVATGQRLYRHRDFRGNIKFLTDDAGQVVTHYHYWHNFIRNTYGSVVDNKTFAGGEHLGNELFWLGARIYDGRVGRFLSQDPVFHLINQYQYADGNAVELWDPDGREAVYYTFGDVLADTGGWNVAGVVLATIGIGLIPFGGVGAGVLAVAAFVVALGSAVDSTTDAEGVIGENGIPNAAAFRSQTGSNGAQGTGQGTGDGQGGGGADRGGPSGSRSSARNAGPASTPWDASFAAPIGGGATCAPASLPVRFSRSDLGVLLLLQLALGAVLLSSQRQRTRV